MQVTPQKPFESENTTEFNFKHEFFKYLRYWPWFICSLILFLTTSFFYLRYTPKVYSTHAKIKILDENSGIELPTTALIVNRSNINLENEMEILTSYPLLERVVNRLKLSAYFFERGLVKSKPLVRLPFDFEFTRSLDSITNPIQFFISVEELGFKVTYETKNIEFSFPEFDTTKSEHQLPFELKWSSKFQKHELVGRDFEVLLVPKKSAILNIKSRIKIEPVGEGSHILNLSIKDQNVINSERILNTLIDVFNQDDVLDRQLIWKRTIDFVDERFVNLSNELDSIESYKKNFKVDNRSGRCVYRWYRKPWSNGLNRMKDCFRSKIKLSFSELIKRLALQSKMLQYPYLPANIGIENASVNALL